MKNSTNHTSQATPIFTATGRFAGEVSNGVWVKALVAAKHMLRKPRAWAVDLFCLEAAEAAGALVLSIFARDERLTYTVKLCDLREHGFRVDRGWGEQIALPLAYWTVTGEDGITRQAARAMKPALASAQLALF